ncbi:connectin-like [Bradysia coprophila]|uniref:connectin-like n=1 Tax=Bradysia coprophila TaxID=38358 RepID=UPI00187D9A0E|nr:connectin-like [Bradysia coprophila]
MGSRLVELVIFVAVLGTASATCRFLEDDYYGYHCFLEHVNATDVSDMVDLSGEHVDGRSDVHVETVIVSPTARLEEIPMNIFATFINLETFFCNANFLRRIDLPFCGPRMRTFQANTNQVEVLQNGAFRGCRSLEQITIIMSDIQRIEENAFAELNQLRDLLLYENPLVELHGHLFRQLPQLQLVRFDQGELTSIHPGTFQCKEFMSQLDLSLNRLERIETGTFTNLLRLRTLNLGRNNIQVIEEGAFANLPLLERLELVENQIAVLDSNLFGTTFQNLNYLGVGSNRINAVDRQVFRRFPGLMSFFGAGNVCFSQNFDDIGSIENDVAPYLETCFTNFDEL